MGGGKNFVAPLPFALGANCGMVDYGPDPVAISYAKQMGMTIIRNEVPWNYTKPGGITAIESSPGTYNATNIATVASTAATLKSAGIKPLFVITVNQNPGLCPTLVTALTSGDTYTSLTFTNLAFAITSGDSIQLINPANQSQTQTVTATSSGTAETQANVTVSVSSFVANANYAAGAWVYDTKWVPCTPQHFATMAAHLVAQSGLQGLDWEFLNEPDGSWGVTATLLTQMYKLAYPAVKAADPTCTVHGVCTETVAGPGYVGGTDYYNACVSAGIIGYYDVLSFHQYSPGDSWTNSDIPPNAVNSDGAPMWELIANFRALMLSHGDTAPTWMTEFGWQNTADGDMTPELQAQFYQDLLVTLSGYDPINKVPFSSYLKAALQYCLTGGGGANWGLIPNDSNDPLPAVGLLTDLVAGSSRIVTQPAGPLPFSLGSNGAMVRYGVSTSDLAIAKSIGMQWFRNDVPWNVNQGGTTPIEGLPGTRSSANLTQIQSVVTAVKSAGLNNLLVVTVDQNPGLCPTLNAALTSGTVYTSITVTSLAFAVASGDSIVLTNPSNQSQTQTVVATANMSAGTSGSLAVSSFTANHNYADGTWVYDTKWVACTPQHFANTMAWLVAQTGLQGLYWELFNEPDGESWGIAPTLLAQAYQLAYPAMKAADPTCTVVGICTESLASAGNYIGIDYYNSCVTAGILGHYDIQSAHEYRTSENSGVKDCAPDALDSVGSYAFWEAVAEFQANRIAKGDTTSLWLTEFGWQYSGVGQMTPHLQAQFYQNLLVTLSGNDPINNVPFSSYLKALFNYDLSSASNDSYWGIAPSDTANPVVALLAKLVKGNT